MRGIAGPVLAFLIGLSLAGAAMERGGRGAYRFDLGPASEIARGQVHAVELKAPGGIRTARRYPRFNAVYVTRTPGGGIAIFPNATPIAGCLLVWRASTPSAPPAFVDPCAGGQWDPQGRYVSGPERQDLLRLPATVSDTGRLIIDTLKVSPSAPAELIPEAMPEVMPGVTLPPAPPAPAAGWAWVIVPTTASPPRSERSWVAGTLITLGRGWGVTAADAAVLLVALALVAGAVAFGAASLWRARARQPAGAADVYLEWRNGRRWSRYPDPPLALEPREERSVRVRLVNEGKRVARGVSVVIETETPLLVHLDARAGAFVARTMFPDGVVHLRWEFERSLPPRGRSRGETLRLSRTEDIEVAGLTRVIVVRCRPAGGGRETSTHVAVRLA